MRFASDPRKGAPAASFRFTTENRPHDPPVSLTADEWSELRGWQRRLDKLSADMQKHGVPASVRHELIRGAVRYVGADEDGAS